MDPLRSTSMLFPALLLSVAACGPSEPSRRVTEIELSTPNSIVVGERSTAQVWTKTDEGCFFETPCHFSATVEVSSTRPDIIRLNRGQVRTAGDMPGEVELTALAVGTATIIADADRHRQTRQVTVVAATAAR